MGRGGEPMAEISDLARVRKPGRAGAGLKPVNCAP